MKSEYEKTHIFICVKMMGDFFFVFWIVEKYFEAESYHVQSCLSLHLLLTVWQIR